MSTVEEAPAALKATKLESPADFEAFVDNIERFVQRQARVQEQICSQLSQLQKQVFNMEQLLSRPAPAIPALVATSSTSAFGCPRSRYDRIGRSPLVGGAGQHTVDVNLSQDGCSFRQPQEVSWHHAHAAKRLRVVGELSNLPFAEASAQAVVSGLAEGSDTLPPLSTSTSSQVISSPPIYSTVSEAEESVRLALEAAAAVASKTRAAYLPAALEPATSVETSSHAALGLTTGPSYQTSPLSSGTCSRGKSRRCERPVECRARQI